MGSRSEKCVLRQCHPVRISERALAHPDGPAYCTPGRVVQPSAPGLHTCTARSRTKHEIKSRENDAIERGGKHET